MKKTKQNKTKTITSKRNSLNIGRLSIGRFNINFYLMIVSMSGGTACGFINNPNGLFRFLVCLVTMLTITLIAFVFDKRTFDKQHEVFYKNIRRNKRIIICGFKIFSGVISGVLLVIVPVILLAKGMTSLFVFPAAILFAMLPAFTLNFSVKYGKTIYLLALTLSLVLAIVATPHVLNQVLNQMLNKWELFSIVDEQAKNTHTKTKWSLNGAETTVISPLDPPKVIVNGKTTYCTIEYRWHKNLAKKINIVKETISKEMISKKEISKDNPSCLKLQHMLGEDLFVEILSFMKPDIVDKLNCPKAARITLNKKLIDRLDARNEETATKEILASRNPHLAVSRARLAIEIYPNALFAQSVIAGQMLRSGITKLRTGQLIRAEAALEEALLYVKHNEDKARVHLALGTIKNSDNKRKAAVAHFKLAVKLAPKHPSGIVAASFLSLYL